MLRFFRQIRQRLITDNRFSKYLLYAVGEILLVVIGILIALQVDNWQTEKENAKQERAILMGIKDDLVADSLHILSRFRPSNIDFNKNVRLFDSLRTMDSDQLDVKFVDSIFARCIRQRSTFFPVAGTYQTIISNGLSELIQNNTLFKRIQNLYERQYAVAQKMGDRTDELSDRIRFELKDLPAKKESERLSFYKSQSSRNDVELWRLQLHNYEFVIGAILKDINSILAEIDQEMNE